MFKKIVSLFMLSAIAFCMTACGSETKTSSNPEERGVTAFVGTQIFEEGLDPLKGAMSYGYPFINNALLRVNPESQYEGDLAESWEISSDALTYTYHLRHDVKFSDGSDFNAEDVVFTYETVMNNPAMNATVDLSRVQSVSAPDDYTVVFQLSQPYSPFFDTTAQLQIVPSDSYDSEGFNSNPIGTGAWKVVQYNVNQQIILEANPNCYYGTPEISDVTLVYMDQDTAFAAAKSGKLDVVMVNAAYANEKIDGMTLVPFDTMDVRNVSLAVEEPHTVKNQDGVEVTVGNAVTSDVAVRKALSIGINRQEIIDYAFNGIGRPAVNFTDNLIWASTEDYADGRVEEAKQILEEAGWIDTDGDGIREKNGIRCSYDVYAASNDPDRYQLAVALAENAKKLGIEINAKTASWDEIRLAEYSSGAVFGWGQYNPSALHSLFASEKIMDGPFDNVVCYSNDEVDAKIQEALNAADPKEAVKAWKEVQTLADADYPYLYLVNIQHCYFINDDLDVSMDTQIPHPHGHGSPIICNMNDWKWK